MRVFTQNDELEKIKYRQRKILEETKRLRNNPRAYLQPLKVAEIERPKSASYDKKFKQLDVDEELLPEMRTASKPQAKLKQTSSNFLNLKSRSKLLEKSGESSETLNKYGESAGANIISLFENKAKQKIREELGVMQRHSLVKKANQSSVLTIKDRFAMAMAGMRKIKEQERKESSSKMLVSRKSVSQISRKNTEEREQLFDKILKFKNSISSDSVSEFHIESQK